MSCLAPPQPSSNIGEGAKRRAPSLNTLTLTTSMPRARGATLAEL